MKCTTSKCQIKFANIEKDEVIDFLMLKCSRYSINSITLLKQHSQPMIRCQDFIVTVNA